MALRRIFPIFAVCIVVLGIAGSAQWSRIAAAQESQTIFDNGNIYAVQNGPTEPTVFTLTEPSRIVSIKTYHWNYGRGARPGTIALRSSAGRTYGPWQAKGQPGQGGVRNAYWLAAANVDLEPDEYTIVDSNPATWAQNETSGGAGMASVQGYPLGNGDAPAN